MRQEKQEQKVTNSSLEPVISKLQRLSNESQVAIASLINRLALAEGVLENDGHRPPIESIDLWLTKLRSERKSERTIGLYEYCARRILRQIPTPTRADVSEYLARRIGETSPSSAETERKALASLFSFLRSEGMWPENPLDGVRHIGPR
ncbi:MAG TPA: hypothetical protein VMW37_04605 [Dehalococcoidales bacterium]|nr:hypothetical protein [Dehalococcoidales bacterium]